MAASKAAADLSAEASNGADLSAEASAKAEEGMREMAKVYKDKGQELYLKVDEVR